MTKNSDRPNILFICDDQHRWDYLNCAGAHWLNTPNLNKLAAAGVRFPVCTSNAPTCVPARVGLATGRQPACIGAVGNNYFLDPLLPTYYQRLRDAGYRVGCTGKLDLGKGDLYNGRDGRRPRTFQWGFTDPVEIEGKLHSLAFPTPQGPYGFWLQEQDKYETYSEERRANRGISSWFEPSDLPAETFLDVYQGDRAVEWLREVPDDSPWHLFVSFSGPHEPHDPPRKYAERYHDALIPEPIPTSAGETAKKLVPTDLEQIRQARQSYCGYIELIDEQIGRILKTLEARPDGKNTYIFFTSDHGEMLGDLGRWAKHQPYEPSTRVPLIVAGPGIPAGQTCDALVEWIDLNPTICELAGLPPQPHIEAQSFKSTLEDTSQPHRSETVSALRTWRCVRTRRYKLIERYGENWELYDLQEDPGEQNNFFLNAQKSEPGLIAELSQRLRQRFSPNPYSKHRT